MFFQGCFHYGTSRKGFVPADAQHFGYALGHEKSCTQHLARGIIFLEIITLSIDYNIKV